MTVRTLKVARSLLAEAVWGKIDDSGAGPKSRGRDEAGGGRLPDAGVSPDFRARSLQVRWRGCPAIPSESGETVSPHPPAVLVLTDGTASCREHFSSLKAEIYIGSPALVSGLRGKCHCPSALYGD